MIFACVITRDPVPQHQREAVARSIVDHAMKQLAYYKAPGYVAFRAELPITSTQKVRLSALGQLIANPAAQPGCFDLRERKQKHRVAR